MDTALSLLISVILILVLIRLRVTICLAILAGAVVLGILSSGIKSLKILALSVISVPTIKILLLVISAFTLGYSMEYSGMFEELQKAAEELVHKFSVALLPLLVGLLPMPGGALVSAVMIKRLVEKYSLTAEESTFINYWFRHVWVTIWPLYPSIIIATGVVEVSPVKIVESCYVIGATAFVVAIFYAVKLGLKGSLSFSAKTIAKMLGSFYPILLVAISVLILKVDMLYTLILAIAIVFIQGRITKKIRLEDIVKILKKTLDPKIVVLIFAVMGYKALIEYTHSARTFLIHLERFGIPVFVAAFAVSFLIGFATGIELSYSSVALPLLTAFTGVGKSLIASRLMLVITGGFCGVMLSPMHLCLALTCEYFHADVSKVYRLLIPAVVIVAVTALLFYSASFK